MPFNVTFGTRYHDGWIRKVYSGKGSGSFHKAISSL